MSKIEIATRLLFVMHWFSDLVEERTKMYSPSHMIPLREVKTYYKRQQAFEAEFAKVRRLLTQTMRKLDNAEYNCVFNEYADQKNRDKWLQWGRDNPPQYEYVTNGTEIKFVPPRSLNLLEEERVRALIPADVQNAANRLVFKEGGE